MKKVLLIIGGVILGLVVVAGAVFFLAPIILSAVDGKDDVLLDDSALLPKAVPIDKPGNAFKTLDSIDFGDENFSEMVQWFDENGITDQVDLTKGKTIVSTHQKELGRYNQAADMSYYQIPYLADPDSFRYDSVENLVPMGNLRNASKIAALNALNLAEQGKTDAAIDQALNIYNVGYMMLDGNTNAISMLIGVTQSRTALSILKKFKDEDQLSDGQLKYIKNYLTKRSNFEAGLKSMIGYEYLISKQGVNDIRTGKYVDAMQAIDEKELPDEAKALKKYGALSYYFKPNQTLNGLIVPLTEQLNMASTPCNFKGIEPPAIPTWSALFTENSVGKLMNRVFGLITPKLYERPCKLQNELNQIINS